MSYVFEDEVAREQQRLRGFLFGPTGSGKSRGALELATRLAQMLGVGVGLINTEPGRGKLYADRYKLAGYIEMADVGDYSPEAYTSALNLMESRLPGGIYILDSVSHEWMGRNGILQQADRFGDWKTVRPKHNDWAERLQRINGHLIVTVRAKMKYEVDEEEVNGRKRQVVRPLGVGPIQSDDLQYDFNLVGQFEQQTHDVRWSGHVDQLVDTTTNFGDEEGAAKTVAALQEWLVRGNPPPELPEAASEDAIAELVAILTAKVKPGGERLITDAMIEETFAVARRKNRGVLTAEYIAEQTEKQRPRAKAKDAAEAAA